MPVIGLTGGIASGKSTVARVFKSKGAQVLDADQVAREVTAPGTPAFRKIVQAMGQDMISPDGGLDRRRLAERIFSEDAAKKLLEDITHPPIFAALQRGVQSHDPAQFVVIEAALLFETLDIWKSRLRLDAVVAVFSSPQVRLQRLKLRPDLTQEAAEARIRAQGPWEPKLEAADFVIDNSGSLEELERKAVRIWKELHARLAS